MPLRCVSLKWPDCREKASARAPAHLQGPPAHVHVPGTDALCGRVEPGASLFPAAGGRDLPTAVPATAVTLTSQFHWTRPCSDHDR
ncbi:Conserved hypothetical protein [Salinibacter ruber M8]|uniref:Uncharacterized protein n=1 Tax=Salinibacter ruber (strain M8) TaxID=761659 RepID=D5H506_SALRM|nr:Conserved hypothetical protein [Salinibacter ruber M8]